MLDGFKKFILRGNVVDMAVGVVIGAAFASVFAGLMSAFLNPLISLRPAEARNFPPCNSQFTASHSPR